MADEQDKGETNAEATDKSGADAGATPKTFTEADLQREADRRVSAAQKAWKADLDAAIADKTKDAETKLADAATRAAEAERKADFLEQASTAGIRNARAAYLVATGGGYIDNKGRLDIDKFRKENPEFFGTTATANAGAGAGAANTTGDMNAFIRAAAGRG
jgi:hypothetical protein